MRILFFHEKAHPSAGGASQYVLDVLPRLRALGHEVALVHARSGETRFPGTGYIFNEIGQFAPLQMKSRIRLEAILDDFRPEVVQFHQVDNPFLDPLVRERAPLLRFVHQHRSYCSGQSMTWRWPFRACTRHHGQGCLVHHLLHGCGSPNPVENVLHFRKVSTLLRALQEATRVQTLTQEVRINLLRNGVSADRVQLLSAPVPPPEVRPAPAVPPINGRRLVLHVGGLFSHKGVWIAIRTLRALPEDCELIFLGGGTERDKLEQHIKQRGLDRRVRIYPDPQPADWARFYAQAECVLAPCLWNEPLALPALRAMAYGKPVVALATGGLPDWIEDQVNGLLVPPHKRGTFPEVVGSLLRDGATLRRLGENARRRWQEKHRMEQHLTALLEGYEDAMEEFQRLRKAAGRSSKISARVTHLPKAETLTEG